jgi:transposase
MLLLSVMINRRPYATDLSDARWSLIEPALSAWRAERVAAGPAITQPVHDLREIVNAILYVSRAGCAWHLLPHDFPPYQTVYGYYAAWEKDGTTAAIRDLLRARVREQAGRSAEPAAAILDARSVKTSCNPPEPTQGVDNAKKIKGRKRHIATDTLGLLLAVLVTAASVQDNAGGQALIRQLAAARQDVTRIWVDAGYKRAVAGEGAAHGMQVEVYSKPAGLKGSRATPRWPVERTFGWFMLHRRLAQDYETLPERSITMIHWSMTDNLSRRLTGESTPAWRTESARTDEPTAA